MRPQQASCVGGLFRLAIGQCAEGAAWRELLTQIDSSSAGQAILLFAIDVSLPYFRRRFAFEQAAQWSITLQGCLDGANQAPDKIILRFFTSAPAGHIVDFKPLGDE